MRYIQIFTAENRQSTIQSEIVYFLTRHEPFIAKLAINFTDKKYAAKSKQQSISENHAKNELKHLCNRI